LDVSSFSNVYELPPVEISQTFSLESSRKITIFANENWNFTFNKVIKKTYRRICIIVKMKIKQLNNVAIICMFPPIMTLILA
jgi:hypothetical protein